MKLSYDEYFPRPPEDKPFGIGVIGCGSIVRGAHLPAYKACGYRVVICCDLAEDAARETAEEFQIPQWTTRLEGVLAHPEVEIIDLAVHARHRLEVVEHICDSPDKPRAILSQKPFALNLEDAERMVELCREAGIVLMINQQGRFAPANRALKKIIESGALGHVYSVVHFLRGWQDEPGSPAAQMPNFNTADHGVHWIDLARYFTGRTPSRVKCTTVKMPGQVAVSPMIYSATYEYSCESSAPDLMATMHFNNIVQTAVSTGHNEWLIDGTEGTAMLIGDDVTLVTKAEPRHIERWKIEGKWWNDAFGGTMGELMRALSENREPMCCGRDNLDTIKVALAMIESSESGQAVEI